MDSFRFCLDRLKNLCQEALVKDLSSNNFCERLRAADMYNASILKWKILNLLQKHRNYIIDNEVHFIFIPFTLPLMEAVVGFKIITLSVSAYCYCTL